MNNGQYGSGFFVLPDQIATAHHVVKETSSGYVSPILVDEKYPIIGISGIDSGNDLVILKVADVQATPLRIGDSGNVKISDTIHVVGNPDGIEGTVSTDEITNDLGTRFLMSAPISPGSSGGAVLNKRGEVIGIAAGSFPGEKNRNQNLNVAIPSKYLTPLIEKAKTGEVLQPLSFDGVAGTHLTWSPDRSRYEFTVRNQQNWAIENLNFLVLFRDAKGSIICADHFKESVSVSAGAVQRISRETYDDMHTSSFHRIPTVRNFSRPIGRGIQKLMARYEIIIDFEINLDEHDGQINLVRLEGVTGSGFTLRGQVGMFADFSYSLKNNLTRDLRGDYVLYFADVVFFDSAGAPIAQSLGAAVASIPAMGTVQVEDRGHSLVMPLARRMEFRLFKVLLE